MRIALGTPGQELGKVDLTCFNTLSKANHSATTGLPPSKVILQIAQAKEAKAAKAEATKKKQKVEKQKEVEEKKRRANDDALLDYFPDRVGVMDITAEEAEEKEAEHKRVQQEDRDRRKHAREVEELKRKKAQEQADEDGGAATLAAMYAMMSKQTKALDEMKAQLEQARTETQEAKAQAVEATSKASALAAQLMTASHSGMAHLGHFSPPGPAFTPGPKPTPTAPLALPADARACRIRGFLHLLSLIIRCG